MHNLDRIGQLGLLKRSERQFDVFGIIFDEQDVAKLWRERGIGVCSCLGHIFDRGKDRSERCAESQGKSLNAREGRIAFAGFDVADVGAMQTGPLGKFFLRDSQLNSTSLYFCAEAFLNICCVHEGIRDMKNLTSNLQTISYKYSSGFRQLALL